MTRPRTQITLREYSPTTLPAAALDHDTGLLLWQRYDRDRGVLSVEFPSPRTAGCWQLTARGWAGFIRVSAHLTLSLQPRLPLTDLFGMLQAAHALQSFHILHGLVHVRSLPALYDRLAATLADGVLQLARQGLAGGYTARREPLPFVRGRLIPQPAAAPTAPPTVLCDYEQWTTDILDNHILAWTLHTLAHAGFCSPQTRISVRRASRALAGQVTLQAVSPAACLHRPYNRLNTTYRPLHALCHFFLSHSTPSHQEGKSPMTAFLVNMPRLYEQFVAATLADALRRHAPPGWTLRAQESVNLPGQPQGMQFTLDLVLYEPHGAPHAVLDTKYRQPTRASSSDVAQVVAYAQAKNCRRAILLYPQALAEPLDARVGDTHVQTFPFGVGEQALRDAQALLAQLVPSSTSM